ncbi:inorganic diphosphatase [bacterium]|nr:inorganic diphosphatase [bacterium]
MSQELKVYLEIPEGSRVKYELDEKTHELCIDRLMPTAMGYPINYGLIEGTLGEDGDASDALVFLNETPVPGVVIKCKPIGVLGMEDEEGIDHKILCVPAKTKIDPVCGAWKSLEDIPEAKKAEIKHFFEHYKDLEEGKWVKLSGWYEVDKAEELIKKATKRFQKGGCDCDPIKDL